VHRHPSTETFFLFSVTSNVCSTFASPAKENIV
jgi:hypothetical protein